MTQDYAAAWLMGAFLLIFLLGSYLGYRQGKKAGIERSRDRVSNYLHRLLYKVQRNDFATHIVKMLESSTEELIALKRDDESVRVACDEWAEQIADQVRDAEDPDSDFWLYRKLRDSKSWRPLVVKPREE